MNQTAYNVTSSFAELLPGPFPCSPPRQFGRPLATAPARPTHAERRGLPRPSGSSALVFFGVVAILYFARDILIPLAFAVSLAFVLSPAVTALQKIHIVRFPATLLTITGAVLLIAAFTWVVASQLIDVANQLPQYRENIHTKLQAIRLPTTGALGRAAESVREVAQEFTEGGISGQPAAPSNGTTPATPKPMPVEVVQPPANELVSLEELVRPFLKPLAEAGIVLIFSVFILLEREDLRNRLLRLAGIGQLNVMTKAIDDAAQRVSRYLLMQLLVNTCFGTLFGIGLYFIGVPNPPLWGLVAAVLRIVPYAGTTIAAALPFALSLAVFNDWLHPLLMALLFAGLELTTANLVEPMLYGVHTGISSLALLVSAVFWTALWGPAGLILSTPLTVCLVVIGRYTPQLAFLHILLGDEPGLAAEAQLYQRLLAMDHEEARAVVDLYLKDHTLADLYDQVLIPAMTMAEQDRHRGAIEAEREEFLYLNVSEMVAEFAEAGFAGNPGRNSRTRVFCVPAYDQADEIACAMLAQLLEQRGIVALSFPAGPTADEMFAFIQPEADDVVCISAVPPYAFTPSRTMVNHLRNRFSQATIFVGIWGFNGDREKALARFDRGRPNRLFSSLADVVNEVVAVNEAAVRETAPESLPAPAEAH